jgi:hypothetical protein
MALRQAFGAEWDVGGDTPDGIATGTATRDTTLFRSPGLASFKFNSTAGNAAATGSTGSLFGGALPALNTTNGVTNFCQYWVNVTNLPASNTPIIIGAGNSTTGSPYVVLTTTGTLQLWDGAHSGAPVQVGSDSPAISTGTWFRVELALVQNGSGTSNATALLNGVQFASGATTAAGANNTVTFGWITAPGASKVINFDDIQINDSTGAANITYPGGTYCIALFPTSDNARVGWTAGGGATTSLFDAVNNTPPVGVATGSATNTSQIKDTTNNTTDTYDANVTTYTAAGMPANGTVVGVQAFAVFSYSTNVANIGGIQITSNPVIAESTFSASFTAGTYPSGWSCVTTVWSENPSVTAGTAPIVRFRKGTASNSRTQSVCAMGCYFAYSVPTTNVLAQPCNIGNSPGMLMQGLRESADAWRMRGRIFVPRLWTPRPGVVT